MSIEDLDEFQRQRSNPKNCGPTCRRGCGDDTKMDKRATDKAGGVLAESASINARIFGERVANDAPFCVESTA